MKYGLVQRKRTTKNENTSWWWLVHDPDEEDREEQKEYTPDNSLFWYYPEYLDKKEVIQRMLDKQHQEIHDSILWDKHSYRVSKQNAEKFLVEGYTSEDFIKTETLPSDEDLLNTAEEDFEKWFDDNGDAQDIKEIVKKAWMECFKRENFIKQS
jgi:pyruvate-formate lyase